MKRRNLLLILSLLSGFVSPFALVAQEIEVKDPARLAANAQAELAAWHGFSGFTADIDVSLAGKKAIGRIIVEPNGRLFVEHLPCQSAAWVQSKLCLLIHQQLPVANALQQKWVFTFPVSNHADFCVAPFDRPFDLTWRIHGGTIRAIEFRTKENRTCVNYLAFEKSFDGKSLPSVVVVHVWNGSKDQLKRTETQVRSWKRIQRFDLPTSIDVLTGEIGTLPQILGSIRLSNHHVFENAPRHFVKR